MNNICIDTSETIKHINNIINDLYTIQDKDLLSQAHIVLINDIIGTLQYKLKEPLLDNTKYCISKGYSNTY